MRKRSRVVPLIVLVAAAGAAYWSADPFGQRAGPKAPPERPFVELEAALAEYTADTWEITTRPRVPGPYRKSREGGSRVGPGGSMVCRVRDDTGAVTEELRVEGDGTCFNWSCGWIPRAGAGPWSRCAARTTRDAPHVWGRGKRSVGGAVVARWVRGALLV